MFSVVRFEVSEAFKQARRRRSYFSDLSVTRLILLDLANAVGSQFRFGKWLPSLVVKLRDSSASLFVRTHSSDLDVVRQIFVEKEYAPFDTLDNVFTIVDLGANIGCASIYFLTRFPEARVIALEPDPRNIEVCRRNLAPFGNRATLLEGAIWSRRAALALVPGVYRDRREWATQVSLPVDGKPSVAGYAMTDLLSMLGDRPVDILKIDVERSEVELFGSGELSWLDRVRNIAIEIHDEECEAIFFRSLNGYSYDSSRSGELTLIRNLRRAEPSLKQGVA